jgi:uncharacterized membrane protein (DUF485 family)
MNNQSDINHNKNCLIISAIFFLLYFILSILVIYHSYNRLNNQLVFNLVIFGSSVCIISYILMVLWNFLLDEPYPMDLYDF